MTTQMPIADPPWHRSPWVPTDPYPGDMTRRIQSGQSINTTFANYYPKDLGARLALQEVEKIARLFLTDGPDKDKFLTWVNEKIEESHG